MTIYTVPAMAMTNEFADLAFVASYVDRLMASTGDIDYGVVFEWDDDGPVPGRPPIAFLTRRKGGWKRSFVLRTRPGNDNWSLAEPEDVNDQ